MACVSRFPVEFVNRQITFVGLDEEAVEGNRFQGFVVVVFAEREIESLAYELSGGLGLPSEAVDYPWLGGVHGLVQANDVVIGFYGVYDERFFPLFREVYVVFEIGDLFFIAHPAFEFVESGLTDGHHLFVLYRGIELR